MVSGCLQHRPNTSQPGAAFLTEQISAFRNYIFNTPLSPHRIICASQHMKIR
jgi:hypothetical protein